MATVTEPQTVSLTQLIDLLNEDLTREYAHWHFYINAAVRVKGLHRAEYSEFFQKAAAGEMTHIQQFGNLILGLGGIPRSDVASFRNDITDPIELLEEALRFEKEVVENYVQRMDQAVSMQDNGGEDRIHGRYIEIFLEDQILDSRGDVDEIRQMLGKLKYEY